jgi:hypothetical protein
VSLREIHLVHIAMATAGAIAADGHNADTMIERALYASHTVHTAVRDERPPAIKTYEDVRIRAEDQALFRAIVAELRSYRGEPLEIPTLIGRAEARLLWGLGKPAGL